MTSEPNPQQRETDFIQIRNTMPRLWWNLYQGCLQNGFDERSALSLVQTFILSQNPHGIRPDGPFGPPTDNPE